MATYREIHGKAVKSLSTDPTAETDAGQIWYNTSSNTFKSIVNLESWVASANMVSPPRIFSGGDGPPTAGWAAGGGSANPNDIANTEEFNGSGWASGGSLPDARYGLAGVGPQTAALMFGGNTGGGISAASLEYDGSSWASPASMPQGRQYINRAGTQTSALAFGGANPGTASVTTTSEYGGSSWTAGGALPVGSEYAGGTGTQTAALSAGGYFQPGGTTEPTATLYYDGSSWSAQSGSLPTGRWNTQAFGTQTDARIVAGQPSPAGNQTSSLLWDGTSWATSATLATARNGATAVGLNGGPTAAGWVGGGSGTLATEEFNNSALAYTAGAWASGGNLNTARRAAGGFGTQTAAVAASGNTSAPGYTGTTDSEEYDGSTWTEGNNVNNARSNISNAGYGPQTSGNIVAGGNPGAMNNYETYDGTDWSNGPTLNTARFGAAAVGTSTAGLCFGGYYDPGGTNGSTNSEEYGGSSWAAGNAMNNARYDGMGFGTQTAGAVAGGYGTAAIANVEEYNGTSWTNATALANPQRIGGSVGTQTDALIFGGLLGPSEAKSTLAQGYDGTTWSSRPSMGTARVQISPASAGTSVLTLGAGGNIQNPVTNATEEFTGQTTAVNIKTLTQS